MIKINEHLLVSEVTKKIDILQAVRWIAEAWGQVSGETIKKCFRSAGILTESFEIISLPSFDEDPFVDADNENEDSELINLISQMRLQNACSVEELIEGEDSVPVCQELADNQTWEERFFTEIGPAALKYQNDSEDYEDEEGENNEEDSAIPVKIACYSDAIKSLEDVRKFLEDKGHTDDATSVNSLISCVINKSLTVSASKQSLITEYF